MSKTEQGAKPIKIERSTKDGTCFVCGRTPEEIDAIIDPQGLKQDIAKALAKRKRPATDFNPATFQMAKTRFDNTTMLVPHDFNGQKLTTSRSFPHYELQYNREGTDTPVPPSEVVEVVYYLPVCPFCSKLLDDASRAAYKAIHAQDFCEDD